MGIDEYMAAGLRDLFAQGKSAVYSPLAGNPVNCKVLVNRNVLLQPAGMEAQAWQRGTTIEALLSDDEEIGIGMAEPSRDDAFVVDGETFSVRVVQENNGYFVTLVVA